MTKAMNHGELAEGIEHLVREYISTVGIAAQGAVERAMAASASGGATPGSHTRQGTRRPSDEIVALRERFYEALCQSPGETMSVLAPMVGATARELNRPMLALKRTERIRSAGTKHATRYFPMASRSPT